MERTARKFFRCGPEDNIIDKGQNTPKENEKQQKQVCFSEKGNHVSQKYYYKGDNNNHQDIYASMAHMYDNGKSPSRYFGDSSQLTNWILDSGAMCHMMPQVLGLIPG